MSKTILTDVGGFTPAIDTIKNSIGPIGSLVFGAVWRYCQMADGRCWAKQEKIAETVGISVRSTGQYLNQLVSLGYLKCVKRAGDTNVYYDTGKAGLRGTFTAFSETDNDAQDVRQIGRTTPAEFAEGYAEFAEHPRRICGATSAEFADKDSIKDTSKKQIKNNNKKQNSENFEMPTTNPEPPEDEDSFDGYHAFTTVFCEATGLHESHIHPKKFADAWDAIRKADCTIEDVRTGIKDWLGKGNAILQPSGAINPAIASKQRRTKTKHPVQERTYSEEY